MRRETQTPFNLIFDPISKSALIHQGDRVTWLAGPFSDYREAMRAATQSMPGDVVKR